jgi:hypothetical protein
MGRFNSLATALAKTEFALPVKRVKNSEFMMAVWLMKVWGV